MSAPDDRILPEGFDEILVFVPAWIGETAQERWDIRSRASMADIRIFYEAVLARSEEILAHVDLFPLDALPPPTLRLFQLELALAQAAMAIELHNQPRAHNSPYPHDVRILRGAQPVQ